MLERNKKRIIIPGILFITLVLVLSGCFTISEGERGVLLRYGKIIRVTDPGLGFKIPLIEKVHKISIQKQAMLFENIQSYSRDQQPATLSVSVNFHIPSSEVRNLYTSYLTVESLKERLIARKIPAQVEIIFGQHTALSAVQHRQMLIQDVQNALKNNITGPVIIDSVQIEGINFSADYENSIEDRMKAEVAIATHKQNLETARIEAQIAVTQAQALADSQLVSAKAEAESIKLKGAAEAEAIRLRAEALQNNSQLTALTAAERWDGKLPATMLPDSSVPFIAVK
ncbi:MULTISPECIES: SPFH domain-containing protein [Erwinia]|uniref:Band 7 domain-containing protein n=2 Tax=Erwinia TaxID=551 RepID=A0A014N592_9GAMM|nr:SPFH domain-containing protein [Erwinia mallotivora]EXU74573.1 hypothetical protein BG55_15815 [Erwinia mallotivora]